MRRWHAGPRLFRPRTTTIPPVEETPAAVKKRTSSVALDVDFADVPLALREFMEPRLKRARGTYPTGGTKYVNVSASGNGFVALHWPGYSPHVRLGSVQDAKVGALLVAAARLDKDLVAESMAAATWLTDLVACPNRVDAWVKRWDGDEFFCCNKRKSYMRDGRLGRLNRGALDDGDLKKYMEEALLITFAKERIDKEKREARKELAGHIRHGYVTLVYLFSEGRLTQEDLDGLTEDINELKALMKKMEARRYEPAVDDARKEAIVGAIRERVPPEGVEFETRRNTKQRMMDAFDQHMPTFHRDEYEPIIDQFLTAHTTPPSTSTKRSRGEGTSIGSPVPYRR